MMWTDNHPCPVCGYRDADCSFDEDGPYSLRCPACRAHLTDPDEIVKEFDSDSYDWNQETMPEKQGLYLVQRGEDDFVAEFIPDDVGGHWELPTDRMGNPYYEGEPPGVISAWAELPKCCHEPEPKKGKR